ncbi:HET-domain-containing protein [Thozetella sp. PMI_491]|nr:HET-domain-containing protein [Thozetella sp. PMI_491]
MQSDISRHQLCVFCQGINLEDIKSNDGYVHQPTCHALISSADTCDLCQLIVDLFKRCIYEQRLATSSIRNLSDAWHLGPVRLFAASRELDLNLYPFQRRERGRVQDKLLSKRVAMTLGMIGSFAESMGVVGLSNSERGIQDDPICDFNISRILSWAMNCEQHHSACNGNFPGSSDGTVAPRRLIDVGLPGQPDVRLVGTDGQLLKYAALSYCWGTNQTGYITTTETISQMMQGVPLALLSQTIQDAVMVVRKLRIRYLWVDALCIVQGQNQNADWMDEIQRMGHIYSNAYLTIGATSASAASQGFLAHRIHSGIPIDFRVSMNGRCEGRVFFRGCSKIASSFREDVEDSPLLRRAWVKQERMFSRRTVDFSSKQIYWTCRMTRHSEDDQEDNDGGMEAAAIIHCLRGFAISLGLTGKRKDTIQELFFRAWADLIQEYSALQLTYKSDRLPALAGIADIASRIVPGQYLSGIWEANLSAGLLWQPAKYPAKLSGIASVPSWSWASVIGPIKAGGHNPEQSRVKLRGSDIHKTGRTALRLLGRVHRCTVDPDKQLPSPPCRSDRKLKDPRDEIPTYTFSLEAAVGPRPVGAKFANDCIFDGPRGGESVFYALGIECDTLGGADWHRGLLLRLLGMEGAEYFYERVGRVRSSDLFWYTARDSGLTLI